MMNEPKAMKEIHDIRIEIYEETKNMTPGQRAERAREAARAFEKKHGIKLHRPQDVEKLELSGRA
jgi:hypothetical protein